MLVFQVFCAGLLAGSLLAEATWTDTPQLKWPRAILAVFLLATLVLGPGS